MSGGQSQGVSCLVDSLRVCPAWRTVSVCNMLGGQSRAMFGG